MNRIKAASLITAVKTPYTVTGDIDLDRYDILVERQIAAGVDGIIVGGGTVGGTNVGTALGCWWRHRR